MNPPDGKSPVAHRLRVLVVDDDGAVLATLRRILEDHQVTCAAGSEEALLAVAEPATTFDVILCDLEMYPMSGRHFYEEIARSRPELLPKIVFITGGLLSSETSTFLRTVPNACFHKPLPIALVKDIVESYSVVP